MIHPDLWTKINARNVQHRACAEEQKVRADGGWLIYGTNGVPDAERRWCGDCGWLRAYVSWWCKNPEAVAYRGTAIPGISGCRFWKPMPLWDNLTWWQRFKAGFHIRLLLLDLEETKDARPTDSDRKSMGVRPVAP